MFNLNNHCIYLQAYKKENGLEEKVSKQERNSSEDLAKKLVNTTPGKMCHDRKSDPTCCKNKTCGIAQ